MDNREWMYMGCPSQAQITREWMDKTEKFLDHAFEAQQAVEAQQEGLLRFVQQFGEQQGWQIPLHLLAP